MSRKIIDKVEYLRVQSSLEKCLAQTPKLELVLGIHNVNMIPEGLNIHYISKQYMNDFEAFSSYDIRTHKLINYGRPAVELNYYYKHKYFVDTKASEKTIKQYLDNHLANLATEKAKLKEKMEKISETKELETIFESYKAKMFNLQEQLDHFEKVSTNLSSMQWVISNYELGFHYYELGFKYWDAKELEYVTYNSHLIKNQHNKHGVLTQERHNVVFVDEQALLRPIANQHKTVEKLLSTFTTQFQLGVKKVYFRKNS